MTFEMIGHTSTEAFDLISMFAEPDGSVWTAVVVGIRIDHVITPTGGHVEPDHATWSATGQFVAVVNMYLRGER